MAKHLVRQYRLGYEPDAREIGDPSATGAVALQLSQLTKVTEFDRSGDSEETMKGRSSE